MAGALPERIVCLTEEPTEVLYALGESHRIVCILDSTVRPPQARKETPDVSAFTSTKLDEILRLEPHLAIGFSDIQADIAGELIKSGVEIWISNHRAVAGIIGYVRRLGAMVGAYDRGQRYAGRVDAHVAHVREVASSLRKRPRVCKRDRVANARELTKRAAIFDSRPRTKVRHVATRVSAPLSKKRNSANRSNTLAVFHKPLYRDRLNRAEVQAERMDCLHAKLTETQ